MKITSVDMFNSSGVLIATLSFRDPGAQNPYQVRTIVGLDADEIVPRFYGISNQSKSNYYNLTMEARDITLRIQLNPQFSTQSYSVLRDALYKMIASSRTGLIELRFNNLDVTVAHIFGFIKKFEAPQFSDTPEVQLTLQCDNPMLTAMTRVESIAAPTVLSSATITDDLSTAPHGFIFEVTFTAPSPSFIIRDAVTPEWSFEIQPGTIGAQTGFITNDKVYYSSESGDRHLYMIRAGVTTHLVDKIVPNSVWPILFPGANFFDSSDEQFTWDKVAHYPTYWGV